MNKLIFLVSIFFLTACGFFGDDFKSQVPERLPFEERLVGENEPRGLPETLNAFAPFYSQAPEGDWAEPWEEACEEASLILAHYGLLGESLSLEKFKTMVLDMVSWQEKEFGFYESTTLSETERLYQAFFEDAFDSYILEAPSIEILKSTLANGHLIVAPFAGRALGNPFYSGEGPYYHMMLIKGYDQKHFITHDVGTKRGQDFIYPYATLMDALHDYDASTITQMPARVLVLEAPVS